MQPRNIYEWEEFIAAERRAEEWKQKEERLNMAKEPININKNLCDDIKNEMLIQVTNNGKN